MVLVLLSSLHSIIELLPAAPHASYRFAMVALLRDLRIDSSLIVEKIHAEINVDLIVHKVRK